MYSLEFLKEAVAELKRLDPVWQKRILNKLKILAEDPVRLAQNIKPLKGQYHDYFRLRIGDYRVIYSQEKARLIILIIRIGHRKEIYLLPVSLSEKTY